MRLLTVIVLLLVGTATAQLTFSMPLRPDLLQKLYDEGRLDEAREALQVEMLRAQAVAPRLRAGISFPDTIKVLVLLVDFEDVKADTILHGRDWFQHMLFDPANPQSMTNYFLANSYGKLDITGEVHGWFRAKQKLSYYADGRRGMGTYPKNAQGMIEDAINVADPSVDFSQFDIDGPDGIVDFLVVVHAGQGYEWTMNPNDIHSHAGTIRDTLVDGVKVTDYATEPEDGRVGTFAHEMGHLLGLPDLYDVTLNSYGLGMWSLMSYGSWGGGDGSRPVGLDAWSKAKLGFLVPQVVDSNAAGLDIPCVEDQPFVLKLWSEGQTGTQYFLVENRRATAYDSYLADFGEGLLVYHVDERYDDNSTAGKHLVYLEQADGKFDLDKQRFFGFGSDKGDPFPGSTGNRIFSWWTKPDNRSDEGQPTEVSLRNISDPGTTMTADIEVRSPVIVFDTYLIDDSAGDKDGEPDPGEELGLAVRLRNQGVPCSAVRVQLSSDDPFVDITGSSADIAYVPGHDASPFVVFRAKIAEDTPQPHNVVFLLTITGTSEAGAYTSTDRFILAVPLRRLAGWPRHTSDVIFSPPAIADLDGDGMKEIVVGGFDSQVYAWKADGTLLPGWPVPLGGRTTSKPAICDINMDGSLDVVIGCQDGKVYAFGRDGRPLPGWPQATGGPVISSVLLADIDDDGVVEIIASSKDGGVYAWNEDGTLVPGWPFFMRGYEIWMSPAAADFDGDNVPEIVVGAYGGKLYVLKGDGTVLPGWPVLFGYGCGGGSPAIADFDGDGTLEIAVSGLFSNSIYVIGADGGVRHGWPRWAYNCDEMSSPVPADLDGDGLPEVAVSTSCGTMVAWNADGSPSQTLNVATSQVIEYCEPLFVDLDGDGNVECIVGTAAAESSRVYAFGRDGVLIGFPVPVEGSVWATPAVADLEDDGHDEMVVATTAGDVYIWRFVGAKAAGRSEWSQSRGDLWNTGCYGFRPLDNIPLPDLAIAAGDISFQPTKPKQGDSLTIRVHAANIGHSSADNFKISVYNGALADSLLIGSAVIPSLAAKHDTTVTFTWKVPGGEPTRLIFASLDSDSTVFERFEPNNVAKQRFYLSVADLTPSISEVYPLPATIGDSLTVHAVVKNVGEDMARNFQVAFCESVLDSSRCFATELVDSLPPGGQADLTVRYGVGPFRSDFVTLVCEVNPDRRVLEYFLGNNIATATVNSGLQGSILAPALQGSITGIKLSRTVLVVEPAACTCLWVVRPGDPPDVLFETAGSGADVSRNTVVFSSEGDIAGYDVKTGLPFVISARPEYESQPAIWGDNVVWVAEAAESTSLLVKWGSRPVQAVRSLRDGTILNPDVSAEIVVWEEQHGADSDIWGYDPESDSLFAVAVGPGVQTAPAVWGHTVVWEDRSRDEGDIYALDVRSGVETAVARLDGAQRRPAISGDIVVWQDSRNGNWDIYGRSLKTGEEFPLSRQTDNQTFPAISESTVVWVDHRSLESRAMGLVFGGKRTVARVSDLEALSQDARIKVTIGVHEYEDGVAYKLYRFSDNKPMPVDREGNVREYFKLAGDSVHVYVDTLVAERKPYYYTLGVIDGYGEETFFGPATGQAYRRSPKRFTVGSPYPNPFRYEVAVAYGLPRRIERPEDTAWPDPDPDKSDVDIRVYSVAGELVRTLKRETTLPGYYQVSWNGTDQAGREVSAGVYFISVSAGNSHYSRKVVLIR